MIRLTDATRLAATKLRTRKVRLVVTVVIAGLLFSALTAASQVSRGAFDSLDAFNQEGFGQRYILTSFPQSPGSYGDFTRSPEAVDRALAIQKERATKKTAEAKRLGIPYDSKSEPPAVDEFDSPDGKQRSLAIGQPAADQAIREYVAAHPAPGKPELVRAAAPYRPIAYHESKSLLYGPNIPAIELLEDGKESYAPKAPTNGPPTRTGLGSFTQTWGLMSRDLIRPFILPGASATIGIDGTIPVIAPYSAVEQLQGLKPLPTAAKPAERLARLEQVRSGAQALRFQACYRNQESKDLIVQAISQQQEIERNKKDKTYVKPQLQYGLPTKACTEAPVIRDVRTVADKKLADKNEQFERLFGKQLPTQEVLRFRVIGVAPDPPNFNASFVGQLVSSLVTSNLGFGAITWFTPLEIEKDKPLLKTLFSNPDAIALGAMPPTQYIEFKDAATSQSFIKEQTCQPEFNMNQPEQTKNPFAACAAEGKHFGFLPFGSNAIALEEAKKWFAKIFTYAALTVAVVAAIIMVGTVGRTIADSRRETAVFRAIGAKKFDIVQIYLIYTLFLSLLIFSFALLTGFLMAQFVHGRYAAEFTIQSLIAYNAQDLSKTFSLYSFYVPDMLRLLGLSLVGGALSAFFPLIRNLRRNPIRDMRDDT